MTEERRQILEMLAAGQINAVEADRFLGALHAKGRPRPPLPPRPAIPTKPAQIHSRDGRCQGREGQKAIHINVRVPIALLRAGVRLASLISRRPGQA